MKRKITAALLAAAILCCASCDSKPAETTTTAATEAAVTEFTAADVTAAVLAEITINSAFEKKPESLPDYFTDLNTEELTDSSYYLCASGAYPDEIAVFKFKSAEAAEKGLEAVKTRLKDQISVYESYTPDEMYKLEGAITEVKGNYVYYLVCSDNSKAQDIVTRFIK